MKSKNFKSLVLWLKEAKVYGGYIVLLLIFWGLVPAVSKLGKMDGIQMTFWVNIFAVATLMIIVPFVNTSTRRRKYKKLGFVDYLKICSLGLVYPLLYSLLYFQAIYEGSPALTQIIGRTSILIYIPVLVYVFRIKGSLAVKDIVLMSLTVAAVLVGLSGKISLIESVPTTIVMAVFAAILNGFYNALADKWKNSYDPLIVTFIIEIVSAIGSAVLIIATNKFYIPQGTSLLYLLLIGVLANGFGFWLYLEGFQKAANMQSSSHKVVFLVFLTGILSLIQALLISISGAENISTSLWIGFFILLSGMTWYGLKKT
jgi:drug/metabolite transporter (DMT)-like permease